MYSHFRATSAPSGLVFVFLQTLVFYYALGLAGAALFVVVPVLGTIATMVRNKTNHAHSEPPRDWRNAVANAGIPALLAFVIIYGVSAELRRIFAVLIVAGLATVLADTLSHEIGAAFGGTPRLVTTFQKVAPGVDGAVSALGSVIMVSVCVSFSFIGMAIGLIGSKDLFAVASAAVLGNLVDTLLGATIQRRRRATNNFVNFASVLSAIASAYLLLR